MKRFFLAAAAAALMAAPVAAQDFSLNPHFGSVRLSAGFTPDPYNVAVTSGGSIDASRVFSNCRGFISNAPDFRLHYNGQSSLPLIISVDSNADTTLVINGPDGQWWCDDDSGDGLNPSVRFSRPMAGQYDIWVGTYNNSYERGTLSISELYSH